MSNLDEEELLLLLLLRNSRKKTRCWVHDTNKKREKCNTTACVLNCNHMKIDFSNIFVCPENVSRKCITWYFYIIKYNIQNIIYNVIYIYHKIKYIIFIIFVWSVKQTYFCTFSMSNSVYSLILPKRSRDNFVILNNRIARQVTETRSLQQIALCVTRIMQHCNTSRLPTSCGQISVPAATDPVLCALALTQLMFCIVKSQMSTT